LHLEGIPASISYCGKASTVIWPTPWRWVLREKVIIGQWSNQIPGLLWNLNFQICVPVSSQLYLILKQMQAVHIPKLTIRLRKIILGLLSHVPLVVLDGLLLHFPSPVIKLPSRLM